MTATLEQVDGVALIRLTSPHGYWLGDYRTVDAIVAAGHDLADLELTDTR